MSRATIETIIADLKREAGRPAPWTKDEVLGKFIADLGPSPEEIRYQKCLALIVAEFKSDPLSVQCFDLRIVNAAIGLVDDYEKRHARFFRKYGRVDEEAVKLGHGLAI